MRDESFVRSLFRGDVDESLIFPWPERPATEVDAVRAIVERLQRALEQVPDAAAIDRDGRVPSDALTGLKALGCFGTLVPKELGGLGLSRTSHVRILQEITAADSSIGITLAAHHLAVESLLLFGAESQKARYLPGLASGSRVAAFALTESEGGSDAASIRTRADPVDDGTYVLHGSKVWVTNGEIADLFVVFARTSPAEEGVKPKLTAFLVERGPGVSSGPNAAKLGLRGASTTEVLFDHVSVGAEDVLGERGRGFKVAVEALAGARLGLAARCVGLSKRAIRLSVERCQHRRAFGRPIGEFGLIKDKIATMVADTWALESMTYLTTGTADSSGGDVAIESAICKVYGSEACGRVVDAAMQIAAGVGYAAGQPYERLLRDARANFFFEGTNEILRAFIALSGMHGPSKDLAGVSRAIREPIKGFGLLGEYAIRKAREVLGREPATRHAPALQREAALFEGYVRELARGVDRVLRRHGRDIAEMQFSQKRLTDMAIDLYAIAACLARTTRAIERRGEEGARREIDLTRIFVAAADGRLAQIAAAIDQNDDELRKTVATKAYADGGYPFDVI